MTLLLRQILVLAAALGGLCACAILDPSGHADAIAASRGWSKTIAAMPPYGLARFGPSRLAAADGVLSVYIEGDGLAWRDTNTPSDNPTPRHPIGLQLAAADPGNAVVYLARPCQFISRRDWGGCTLADWTAGRFSPAIIAAYGRLLDDLKAESAATGLELIGYSGGGVVAALLAERRSDVVRLVTVAAPLDVAAWTEHHGVSPLSLSLDPITEIGRLAGLSQVHLTGRHDRVVPAAIIASFLRHLPPDGPVRTIAVDASHDCCWEDQWPSLRRQMGPPPPSP